MSNKCEETDDFLLKSAIFQEDKMSSVENNQASEFLRYLIGHSKFNINLKDVHLLCLILILKFRGFKIFSGIFSI